MLIQGLKIEEEEQPSIEGHNDRTFTLGRYYDGIDESAGIHITTSLQFNDTEGNFGKTKVIWLHRDCLPFLRDAIDTFLATGQIESKCP